jgi:hypothetical protein
MDELLLSGLLGRDPKLDRELMLLATLEVELFRAINRGGSISFDVPQGRNGGAVEKPPSCKLGEYIGYEAVDLCFWVAGKEARADLVLTS